MASASRLPLKFIAFTTALILGGGISRMHIRNLVLNTFTGPGSYSRIIAILIISANLKNLPWVWHFRLMNSILKHCLFSIPKMPAGQGPSSLFLPVITTSHSPLTECDYNFHKSNSTYFSDLDVTRGHLVCCLFQKGIHKLQHNQREQLVMVNENGRGKKMNGNDSINGNGAIILDESIDVQVGKMVPAKGAWFIMLGSVQCSFCKEIKPYESYDMWSRLLCWDRKWIYILTHFVKAGSVKPKGYVFGDGSWFSGKHYSIPKSGGDKGHKELEEKAIFASAISKYVVKLGRLTVHPEVLIEASELLPPKPGGWATMTSAKTENGHANRAVVEGGEMAAKELDWKRIQAENERGLKYVEHFAALDELKTEFTGSGKRALGRYRDFLW